jgi:hypothetical protein
VAAATVLKKRGAYKIYIVATHGLLSGDAPALIEESCIDQVCYVAKPNRRVGFDPATFGIDILNLHFRS